MPGLLPQSAHENRPANQSRLPIARCWKQLAPNLAVCRTWQRFGDWRTVSSPRCCCSWGGTCCSQRQWRLLSGFSFRWSACTDLPDRASGNSNPYRSRSLSACSTRAASQCQCAPSGCCSGSLLPASGHSEIPSDSCGCCF